MHPETPNSCETSFEERGWSELTTCDWGMRRACCCGHDLDGQGGRRLGLPAWARDPCRDAPPVEKLTRKPGPGGQAPHRAILDEPVCTELARDVEQGRKRPLPSPCRPLSLGSAGSCWVARGEWGRLRWNEAEVLTWIGLDFLIPEDQTVY